MYILLLEMKQLHQCFRCVYAVLYICCCCSIICLLLFLRVPLYVYHCCVCVLLFYVHFCSAYAVLAVIIYVYSVQNQSVTLPSSMTSAQANDDGEVYVTAQAVREKKHGTSKKTVSKPTNTRYLTHESLKYKWLLAVLTPAACCLHRWDPSVKTVSPAATLRSKKPFGLSLLSHAVTVY